MARATKTYVEINGVDVSTYVIRWKHEALDNKVMAQMEITLQKGVDTVLTIDETLAAKSVIVQRGVTTSTEEYVFRGEVFDWDLDGAVFKVVALDKLAEAKRTILTSSFDAAVDPEAGVISEIVKALITENTSLSADATSITNSGTTDIVDKFIINNTNILDRVSEAADALNWQLYYSAEDDKVYFEPKGATHTGLTLTVGTEIPQSPKWNRDKTKLANKVVITGGESEVETTETFTATAAQTTFTLQNRPQSVKVFVDSVLKVGGKTGSTSSSFDYELNELQNQVVFQSGLSGGESVEIRYSYFLPVKISSQNPVSIASYGVHAVPLTKLEYTERADLTLYAKKYMATYAEPFLSSGFPVINVTSTLQVGRKVIVVDNRNNINQEFVITKITQHHPHRPDIIEIGDKPVRVAEFIHDKELRIRRIEESIGKAQDLINVLFDFDRSIVFKRRLMKLEKQDVGTSFVLGNVDHGELGTDELGDQKAASTTEFLIPGENDFRELVYDTDFIDTGSTTATVNTTNQDVTFTSGQLLLSEMVAKGTTYSFATVNLGTTTGNLLIEVTCDNKVNWQTLAEGTRTSITNADANGVFYRITENAAGAATINNTTSAVGQITEPAVQILLEE